MKTREFGIYIKTHRPDYYLAKPLIASLRRYAPECDITLVPDDGFSEETLWGFPTLRLEGPEFFRARGRCVNERATSSRRALPPIARPG